MTKAKKRNWLAVRAKLRPGAGAHTDKKKQENKKICRKKVEESE